jgi:predicted transcriptional regulator
MTDSTKDKIEAVKIAAAIISEIQSNHRLDSQETEQLLSEVTKRLLETPEEEEAPKPTK